MPRRNIKFIQNYVVFFSYVFIIVFLYILYNNKYYYNNINQTTTFIGSNFDSYIVGELLKKYVIKADTVLEHIKGVRIGETVTSIGNINDTIDIAPFYNQNYMLSLSFKGNSQCTIIGDNAFKNNINLNSVIFTDNIIIIGNNAFENCDIISLIIPNFLNIISNSVFKNNINLNSINFGTGVNLISDSAFYGCNSLLGISIPDNIIDIGTSAFYDCSLEVLSIGTGVINIGDTAFYNNNINPLIWEPGNARGVSIGANAFTSPYTFLIYNNTTYNVPLEGAIFTNEIPNSYTTFLGSDYSILIIGELTKAHVLEAEGVIGTIKGVSIGTSVSSIGNLSDDINTSPFYNQSSIINLSFKDINNSGCSIIGANSFYNCNGFDNITLPSSLRNLGDSSFKNTILNNLIIPEGVININDNAFESCNNLKSVSLPSSLITLGVSAFKSSGLSSIILPDNLNYIDINVFNSCSGLSIIDFGNGVSIINTSAFESCTNLIGLSIPNNIINIGISAFKNNSSLINIEMGTNLTTINADAFSGCPLIDVDFINGNNRSVSFGIKAFDSPVSAKYYNNSSYSVPLIGRIFQATDSTIFTGVSGTVDTYIIGTLTQAIVYPIIVSVSGLVSLQIGTYITSIGTNSDTPANAPFYSNTSLTDVSFRDVENSQCSEIGSYAFSSSNINTITYSNSVTIVGDYAFEDCLNLVSNDPIPPYCTRIKTNSWNNCTGLTAVVMPQSLTNLGFFVFEYCANISSITFPTVPLYTTLTGNNYFGFITSLKNVYLPDNITLTNRTFYASNGILNVSVGPSMVTLNHYTFALVNTIISFEFRPGNARFVTLGIDAVGSPASLSAYNNSSVDISIDGEIFT